MFMVGCASQHRPDYEQVTVLVPDCANRDGQIRYLQKMLRFDTDGNSNRSVYDQTIALQIQRLGYYCQ